jgi:hypothetical protein
MSSTVFSVQPRITIPFSGAINLATVTRDTVFLVRLRPGRPAAVPARVALNQLQWDEISQTLVGTPDELLAQPERYLLVVTDGVKANDVVPVAWQCRKARAADIRERRSDGPESNDGGAHSQR